MFSAFGQFFRMFFALFSAGEKLGISLDNLASIAVDESEGLKDIAAVSRDARLKRAKQNLDKLTVVTPKPADAA